MVIRMKCHIWKIILNILWLFSAREPFWYPLCAVSRAPHVMNTVEPDVSLWSLKKDQRCYKIMNIRFTFTWCPETRLRMVNLISSAGCVISCRFADTLAMKFRKKWSFVVFNCPEVAVQMFYCRFKPSTHASRYTIYKHLYIVAEKK